MYSSRDYWVHDHDHLHICFLDWTWLLNWTYLPATGKQHSIKIDRVWEKRLSEEESMLRPCWMREWWSELNMFTKLNIFFLPLQTTPCQSWSHWRKNRHCRNHPRHCISNLQQFRRKEDGQEKRWFCQSVHSPIGCAQCLVWWWMCETTPNPSWKKMECAQ